jgi:protein-L-isoaspartate(D-aspartate) O-methyltransferase
MNTGSSQVDKRVRHHVGVMGSSEDAGAGLRADLVALLAERGSVSDSRVAAALGQVPRHVFVPAAELADAYADQAIVTHHRDGVPTSSASQPAMVAAMLEQLRPPPGGSILEIGAGTGYNAALLSELVGPSGRVVTVDIDPEVADEARGHLSEAGVTNVVVICGDGALGEADGAPYDGIIVTAGVADLAPAWMAQLRPGGVPAVFEFAPHGLSGRASPCLLGPAGFAALDLAGPAVAAEGPVRHRTLELAVRGYGEAAEQAARLAGLATAWDAAGRPGIDRLHIDAYPSGTAPPADADPHTTLHRATHTTFAVRFRPVPAGQR